MQSYVAKDQDGVAIVEYSSSVGDVIVQAEKENYTGIQALRFALYLFHPFVAPLAPSILKRVGLNEVGISIVGCIMISIVVSMIAFVVVERPTTRYLNRHLL